MKFINIILCFRYLNGQMELCMLEIGKTIKKKEKELKLIILDETSLNILSCYFVLGF